MSGIIGFIGKTENEKTVIRRMSDSIAVRGRDQWEECGEEEGWALGQRLTLPAGETLQNLAWNEDGSAVCLLDGEIYNAKDLRKELQALGHSFCSEAAAELMLHGYEQWGTALSDHVDGPYAMAIWNKQNKELLLMRDPFGCRPLYYGKFGDCLIFASELKAFLHHPTFRKEFNQEILSAYLCFNSTPTRETFFKNVFRVEPGEYVRYQQGKLSRTAYFFLEFAKEKNTTVPIIQSAMEESIQQMKSDGLPFGSFLSGGVDSSYIVSLAHPVKTYTVGYDNARYDESADAEELSRKLGISHAVKKISKEEYLEVYPKLIYYLDEPVADPAVIALYFTAKMAAEDVSIVTSGEGGDELFAGYNTYLEEIQQSWYMRIPFPIRRAISAIAGLFPEKRGMNFLYRRGRKLEEENIGSGRIFRDKDARKIVRFKDQLSTTEIVRPFYQRYQNQSNLEKRQAIDFYFWLVKDFLHAGDRMASMFGLNVRTPFLNRKIYEAAMGLSDQDKLQGTVTKAALREAAGSVIPTDAYKKKKLGFPVPLRDWMQDASFRRVIREAFNSPAAEKLFDRNRLRKLLVKHEAGKKDEYKKIWTIYTIILWYQEFIEKPVPGEN